MNKYWDNFKDQFGNMKASAVEKLTDEINDARNKEKLQREVDNNITRVCRGEVKRRGKK